MALAKIWGTFVDSTLAHTTLYNWLLRASLNPDDLDTQCHAHLLAQRLQLGWEPQLDAPLLLALLEHYFPQCIGQTPIVLPINGAILPLNRLDEVTDLVQLLNDYSLQKDLLSEWRIQCIAQACLLPNHLWEDLGLSDRAQLSHLMRCHFPVLYARNQGMRWKKFFYKQLCEREEIFICRAPSCQVCDEYSNCFGPE